MTDRDALKKRLRASCNCNIDENPCGAEHECRLAIEAAEAIEALEAEVATSAPRPGSAMSQLPEPIEALEIDVLCSLPREVGFCSGIARVASDLELHPEVARGLLRGLRVRGDVEYCRGLWTEDGRPAGAGYGLTRQGRERVRQHEEATAPPPTLRCEDCRRPVGEDHQSWCPLGDTVQLEDCIRERA